MKEHDDDSGGDKRPSLKLRPMEIDDLPGVFHLGEQLFKAEEVPSMYRTWDPYEVVGLFHSDTEFCLVAEIDEAIVGFALGTTIEKRHSAWKYGYLIWLGVSPEVQRKGVAEKLVRKFKDILLKHGVRMIIVDTPAENLPALQFFRKFGFGQPRQHIYLSLNLAAEHQRKKQRENGESPRRATKNHG